MRGCAKDEHHADEQFPGFIQTSAIADSSESLKMASTDMINSARNEKLTGVNLFFRILKPFRYRPRVNRSIQTPDSTSAGGYGEFSYIRINMSQLKSLPTIRAFLYIIAVSISALAPNTVYAQSNQACNASMLTGDRLAKAAHIIASHGDISDIAFLEKELDVKLIRDSTVVPSPSDTENEGAVYGSITGSDSSVDVDVSFGWSKGQKPENGVVGILRIWIRQHGECLKLKPSDIYDQFPNGKDGFREDPVTDAAPFTSSGLVNLLPGKNKTKMFVGFSFSDQSNIVSVISIQQVP